MASKYYITWGEHRYIKVADTPMKACMAILRHIVSSAYVDAIPRHFRVSSRGHTERDDDTILETMVIWEKMTDTIPRPEDACERCGKEFEPGAIKNRVYHTLSPDSDAKQEIEICEVCYAKLQPSG